VVVDGEEIGVIPGSFEPQFSFRVAGEEVDVLQVADDVIATIRKN